MEHLREYKKIVGKEVIDEIKTKARHFSNSHILFINSTYQGGGVAELLNTLVPLLNDAGIKLGWRVLQGSQDFFLVTKNFHNALQNQKIKLTEAKKKIYYQTNKRYAGFTHIEHDLVDLVVVHDPQPLPLIKFYKKKQPWIFRCHIDLSEPDLRVWEYLKSYIKEYDNMVVSTKDYIRNDLKIPQSVIYPAIDPLSAKNKKLSNAIVKKYLKKYNIDYSKPIISQISRFDKWKDPVGVIKIFENVRKKYDCQLVLLGSLASDDPEGQTIFEQVRKVANNSKYKKDIKLILVNSDILVNCLQTASKVVIQKSIKEGFGLTVSEALFKGTPVVASRVGGIPLQVIDGVNGFLHEPNDIKGFSESVLKILKDEKLRENLGKIGHEHVKENFLITRLMLDWLNLFKRYLV